MRKFEFPVQGGFANFVSLIERYAKGLVGREALQDIHIVGYDGLTLALLGKVCVPAGPGRFSPGEQGIIAVQGNHVFFVRKGFQKGNLIRAGGCDQAEGLVGMTGQNDFVEGLHGAVGKRNFDPIFAAGDFLHCGIESESFSE